MSAFAVALLATSPLAAAAASPSPETMRAALADPIDKSFIEAEVGAAGTLEGPFNAGSYANYYKFFGMDDQTARSLVRTLQSSGFAGGYGRTWYQPRNALEYLGELVMVFNSSSGASSIASSSKIRYQQDAGFQSMVEPHLNKGSYGVTEQSGGFWWTVVIFQKGSNLFAVTRGSDVDLRTEEALAQARRAYDVAPSSIPRSVQPNSATSVAQHFRLVAVVGLILLLAIATVVAAAVFGVFAPRTQPKP